MGQYYKTVLTDQNGRSRAYNRTVDGKYMMAKLMEHSWWYNEFVSTICKKLYKSPHRVAWVGDYADDADPVNNLSEKEIKTLWKKAWRRGDGNGVSFDPLTLDIVCLVNHTKKQYLNGYEYKKRCRGTGDDVDWIIHPLPLLTAIGNGQGGGDYRGIEQDWIGAWANDLLEIVRDDAVPEGYTKIDCTFKEER